MVEFRASEPARIQRRSIPSDAAGISLSIALVTETYPDDVNGVAMTLGRLVAGMRAVGHRVQVVRSEPAAGRHDGRHDGDLFIRPGLPLPMYPELRIGVFSRSAMLAEWRSRRPDVVHVATEGPLGLSALFAAGDLGLPITTTFHTNLHTYTQHYHLGWLEPVTYGYLRWFHNRTSCTLVPTAAQAVELRRGGFRRVGVLSRGIDTRLYAPTRRDPELRSAWGVGPDDLVLVCVGRVAAEKNLELAVRSFTELRRQRPSTKLVLVGDGPMRAEVHDLSGVVCCGMRRGEDLARHYASADCLLFPSLTETYGNVLVEGMASGLPSVSFRYAAAAERVEDGVDGRTVPHGDADAFVAAVLDLAGQPAERRREMGRRAREAVLPVSWEGVVADFVGHLRAARAAVRSQGNGSCSPS